LPLLGEAIVVSDVVLSPRAGRELVITRIWICRCWFRGLERRYCRCRREGRFRNGRGRGRGKLGGAWFGRGACNGCNVSEERSVNNTKDAPSEKKSSCAGAGVEAAGAGLGLEDSVGPSSDILDRPFVFTDEGRNNVDTDVSSETELSNLNELGGSGSASNELEDCSLLLLLNTKPGPLPPPRTLSGFGKTTVFCFGAGSIDKRPETPAPAASRGFFGAGSDSSSLSSSSTG